MRAMLAIAAAHPSIRRLALERTRPMPAPTELDPANPLDRGHRRLYRRIGTAVGLALLVAAVVGVVRNEAIGASLQAAWNSPRWGALALLVGSVLATQLLTSATFALLVRRHAHVGFAEMNALVAASTLANYVPMQAGSIGRLAYHRTVHGIPVRASLVAILQAMAATAVATCAVGAAALLGAAADAPWWAPALVPALWLPLAIDPGWRTFALVMVMRTAEVLAWAVHAWAAFRLSGWDVGPQTAVGAAVVASAANLVPFIGNGLGIREWAVALAAPVLGGYERDAGLAAELTGRAVDVAVAVPLGLASFAVLVRRLHAAAAPARER
jgi:uncharacterized membrane protein YbhN (UPF0104 family)